VDSVVKKEVCIIGKGSIGTRHGKIFKRLGCNVTYFRRKKSVPLSKNEVTNIKNLKKKVDLVCICNPTSLHSKTFIKFQNISKNFFIEKPSFHKLTDIKKVYKILKKKKINIFSGYMFRFDPRISLIKKIIKKSKIRYANFIWQSFLPNWHPWENYRKSYASNKKLGGGVLLTCSHEIDIAQNLFGKVSKVFCTDTLTSLKSSVENSIFLILKHKNGIKSNITLDFSSKQNQRQFEITGENFNINWNFSKKQILIKKENRFFYKIPKNNSHINKIYFSQNKTYLKNLYKKQNKNFDNLFHTERVILAALKSLRLKKIVSLV
jgi:predicted dehydrogenase